MCLILDTNKYSDYLDLQNNDMYFVREWIERKGKIAYSRTDKFEKELTKSMQAQIISYAKAGKLKLCSVEEVEEVQKNLSGLKSDDPHIIALAMVAKAKLLVSSDHDLHTDFKKIVKGKVYQDQKHKHLLYKFSCS